MHRWVVSFIYKTEAAFDRHKVTIFQKKMHQLQSRGYVYMRAYFYFKNSIYLSFKTPPHCLLFSFVCYKNYRLTN